jgi:hypothetical protein
MDSGKYTPLEKYTGKARCSCAKRAKWKGYLISSNRNVFWCNKCAERLGIHPTK